MIASEPASTWSSQSTSRTGRSTLPTGRAFLRRAFDAAQEAGDLTYAAYSCIDLNTNLLASGDPLDEVEREAENGLEFARKVRFGLVSDIITAQLGLVRTLRGLTPDFGSFNDAEFDESRFEHILRAIRDLAFAACWYWIRKLQACIYAGDYASAIAAASKAAPLLWTSPTQIELAEYHFYGALARAARCDTASAEERPQHLAALAAHHRQIAVWAENCPATFANRAALVGAEIARLEGRELDAERLYEAGHPLGARARLRPERGAWPMNWPRASTRRAASRRSPTRICGTRGTAIFAGAPIGKVRQLEQTVSASPRRISPCISHQHHWCAGRAAGCRDGAQGLAGGVRRDRPRQAHRDADADRDRACRCRAWPADPVRRATSHGSRRKRRPAAAGSRSRCARRPCHQPSFPNPCSTTSSGRGRA